MQATVETFFHKATNSFTYLVWEDASRRAAVIDPVLDYDAAAAASSAASVGEVGDRIEALDLALDWILETHVHADHLSAAQSLQARCGGKTAIGASVTAVQVTFRELFAAEDLVADGSQWDRLLQPDERLPLGGLEIQVLATPGHTPACVTYVIGDAAFVGDTLFMPDFGTARCDFPGGDAAQLYRSIRAILALPPETRLFMCHDYCPGGRDLRWETSVAEQLSENVHLQACPSAEAFVDFRAKRDSGLSVPALLLPAVQVNIRAGRLPPAAENGTHYLKIPLNRL
ncbi:MAG: MBL fold metallo-hydrolase [Rhodospirillales bacterium]